MGKSATFAHCLNQDPADIGCLNGNLTNGEAYSVPLLDRIDIHKVPRVDYDKLTDDRLGEPLSAIRARVERAREAQRERFLTQSAALLRLENRLLLIDEPSEGLAPVIIEQVMEAVRQLSAHTTVLLVEQNFHGEPACRPIHDHRGGPICQEWYDSRSR